MTDRVMFSSDYPHWDFDSPAKALPAAMPAALRGKIMGENAARLYARRLSTAANGAGRVAGSVRRKDIQDLYSERTLGSTRRPR